MTFCQVNKKNPNDVLVDMSVLVLTGISRHACRALLHIDGTPDSSGVYLMFSTALL